MPIFGLFFPIILGFVVTLLVNSEEIAISERIALSYGLGFGLLTLGMFLLNIVGIKFSLMNTTLLISGIIIVGVLYVRRKIFFRSFLLSILGPSLAQKKTPFYLFEKIIIALICFFLISVVIIAIYWPVGKYWDTVKVYDLRARILAEVQSFPQAVLTVGEPAKVFNYPPLTSLANTWLYLCGWASAKIFYPLLLLSLSIIFYCSMRDYGPRYHCLLFTLILVATPMLHSHATYEYLSLPFAYYFSIGTLYLYRWMSTQKRGFLTLAGLFLGLSSWVRAESPIFFLGYLVILTCFSISRRNFFAPFLFSIPYMSIAPLWEVYTTSVLHLGRYTFAAVASNLLESPRGPLLFLDLARWKEAVLVMWKNVLIPFRGLLCVLALATLLRINRVKEHYLLFLIILFDIILFIAGIYGFTFTHRRGWLDSPGARRTSIRLFMIFLPIIWYFIALMTAEHRFSDRKTSGDSIG